MHGQVKTSDWKDFRWQQWLVIINLTWFFANESEYFYGPSFYQNSFIALIKTFLWRYLEKKETSLIVAKRKDDSEYHISDQHFVEIEGVPKVSRLDILICVFTNIICLKCYIWLRLVKKIQFLIFLGKTSQPILVNLHNFASLGFAINISALNKYCQNLVNKYLGIPLFLKWS